MGMRKSEVKLAAWGLVVSMGMGLALAGPACTQQQAQTAANVAIRIATDVCQEESQQPADPAWVALACKVVGAVSGLADSSGQVVHVQIPRVEWVSLKTAAVEPPSAK